MRGKLTPFFIWLTCLQWPKYRKIAGQVIYAVAGYGVPSYALADMLTYGHANTAVSYTVIVLAFTFALLYSRKASQVKTLQLTVRQNGMKEAIIRYKVWPAERIDDASSETDTPE
jgi:hypothetical protein